MESLNFEYDNHLHLLDGFYNLETHDYYKITHKNYVANKFDLEFNSWLDLNYVRTVNNEFEMFFDEQYKKWFAVNFCLVFNVTIPLW